MKKNDKKTYGKIIAEDGEFGVIDYIQTQEIDGRKWTLILLSDNTVAFRIESIHEKTKEPVIQTMRLTPKSITILQYCLTLADSQFNINMEEIAKELVKNNGDLLNIKTPNKD